MSNPEKAVRDAANKLHEVIVEAGLAGLNVQWPGRVSDLPSIAISETAKAKQAPKPAEPISTIKKPIADKAKGPKT